MAALATGQTLVEQTAAKTKIEGLSGLDGVKVVRSRFLEGKAPDEVYLTSQVATIKSQAEIVDGHIVRNDGFSETFTFRHSDLDLLIMGLSQAATLEGEFLADTPKRTLDVGQRLTFTFPVNAQTRLVYVVWRGNKKNESEAYLDVTGAGGVGKISVSGYTYKLKDKDIVAASSSVKALRGELDSTPRIFTP